METKYKYVGYNIHRLKEDDEYYAKEVAFVEEVNKEISQNGDFLHQIVNKKQENGRLYWFDENEEKVALSVIQWLGTPVGQGFLEKVQKINKNGK